MLGITPVFVVCGLNTLINPINWYNLRWKDTLSLYFIKHVHYKYNLPPWIACIMIITVFPNLRNGLLEFFESVIGHERSKNWPLLQQ